MYILRKTPEEKKLINQAKAKLLSEDPNIDKTSDGYIIGIILQRYIGGKQNERRSKTKTRG